LYVHCDLYDSSPISSTLGFTYYIIFVNDYFKFTWFYPLKFKSVFFFHFIQFKNFVKNKFSIKIKTLQSDGEAEFTSHKFKDQLTQSRIHHYVSCLYTPSQNRRVEHKHQYINEIGIAMLFHSCVPLKFWVDAFNTATSIINWLPTSTLHGVS